MLLIVIAGLALIATGFAIFRYRRQEEIRRIAAFDRAHTVLPGEETPKVLVRSSGAGTEFVNIGGTMKFRPPEGFVSMERTIEGIRKELTWAFWLGTILCGSGLLLIVVGLLRLAVGP